MNVIVLLLVFFFCTSAARADEDVPRFIRIPLLFITDRDQLPATKLQAIDFGPHRKYVGECLHDPFMGSGYCVVENVDHKTITPELKALGWEPAAPKEKLTASKAELIAGANFDETEKKFYGKVHDQALLSKDKTLCIFAHGYKYTFRRSMFSAARLAYSAERPLLLYSWPSVAKLRSYTADENNVEWSQDHFNDMITDLKAMCASDPSVHLRMYAHSMGNRLVVRACPLLKEQACFLEYNLICPDIDDGLVQHYARRYLSGKGTAHIRLYISTKDKALAFSQLLHGGYVRLGECADSFGGLVGSILGDQNNGSAVANSEEERAEQELIAKTKARIQTIDFTNIDVGWMGHSIPDDLICSMSMTGKPSAGLSLEEVDSGNRGKTTNLFAKFTKVSDQDPNAKGLGKLLKVVKVSTPTKVATKPANN